MVAFVARSTVGTADVVFTGATDGDMVWFASIFVVGTRVDEFISMIVGGIV